MFNFSKTLGVNLLDLVTNESLESLNENTLMCFAKNYTL
jgi:hypothetical protein